MSEIFQTLMTLETLQALVLGTAGGLLIGGMPGLTATMGMALLISIFIRDVGSTCHDHDRCCICVGRIWWKFLRNPDPYSRNASICGYGNRWV